MGRDFLRGRFLSFLCLGIGGMGVLLCTQVMGKAQGKTLVLGVRGNENWVQAHAELGQDRLWLRSDTKEFDNGNTFVRLQQSTMDQDVEIWIPDALTPDQLMEALIKIRIARSEGAHSVTVRSQAHPSSIRVSSSENWMKRSQLTSYFQAAGAQYYSYSIGIREKLNFSPRRDGKDHYIEPARETHYLMGELHPQLRDELSAIWKMPIATFGEKTPIGSVIYLVAPSVVPVNESFFRVLSEIQFLKSRGNRVVLITPYLPYARSDKKDQPGVAITGRLIADLIEVAGTDRIAFVRAHAPQSEGFFSIPTIHVDGRKTICDFLRANGVQLIVSPDAGFQKDADRLAEILGVPVEVINKSRDVTSGEASIHTSELGVEEDLPLKGLTVAVTDDETSSGKTLGMAATHLKSRGAARVIGIVTHLNGNAQKALEASDLDMLVVTDSNPVGIAPSEKFRVISLGKELAEAIRTRSCSDQITDVAREQRG